MLSEEFESKDLLPLADRRSVLSACGELRNLASESVFSILDKKAAVAFSGGIDSSIVSKLISERDPCLDIITLGREGSTDLQAVSNLGAGFLGKTKIHRGIVSVREIEQAAVEASKVVSVSNLAHFEDCLSFLLIAKKAKENPAIETLVSANGPDELFCGYDRFRRILDSSGYESVRKEIESSLQAATSLGTEVRKVVSSFGLELAEPLFNEKFIDYALTIPAEFKILLGNDLLRKRIWRLLGRELGLPERIVLRPKKAMQYGMGIHPVVLKMCKDERITLTNQQGSATD